MDSIEFCEQKGFAIPIVVNRIQPKLAFSPNRCWVCPLKYIVQKNDSHYLNNARPASLTR